MNRRFELAAGGRARAQMVGCGRVAIGGGTNVGGASMQIVKHDVNRRFERVLQMVGRGRRWSDMVRGQVWLGVTQNIWEHMSG